MRIIKAQMFRPVHSNVFFHIPNLAVTRWFKPSIRNIALINRSKGLSDDLLVRNQQALNNGPSYLIGEALW